jgi:catechol 2,3-dioxygenase-like lactoylglutathione lyase family enzyme
MTMADDPRPRVWVGHIVLNTTDLDASDAFMQALGMRPIFKNEGVAILELRGGTHIVLEKGEVSGEADFDLMVDDIDQAHADYAELGLSPSEISHGSIHDAFTVRDPGGATITVNSNHVSDLPV